MTVDGNQTSRIGAWGRIAIVFGTVLSIAWIGAMFVRGSEQMRSRGCPLPMTRRDPARKGGRRTVPGSGCAPTLRLRSVSATLPTF